MLNSRMSNLNESSVGSKNPDYADQVQRDLISKTIGMVAGVNGAISEHGASEDLVSSMRVRPLKNKIIDRGEIKTNGPSEFRIKKASRGSQRERVSVRNSVGLNSSRLSEGQDLKKQNSFHQRPSSQDRNPKIGDININEKLLTLRS